MSSALLSNRGFISIQGEDAHAFLQGIVTNDVFKVSAENSVYACFLTPQGKYLADFFLYPQQDGLLLDVDKSLLPDLLKRLSMYRLRSKVTLTDVSEQFTVTAFWNENPVTGFADPRLPEMGYRVLNIEKSGSDDYSLWQMQNGVPDVPAFTRERTSMLEANMDLLHAIAWDKGCYMGQELTARTHYRGLIKKRFLPLKLSGEANIERDSTVKLNDKTIGHVVDSYKGYVLALMTLEGLENSQAFQIADQEAVLVIPKWFKL